MRGRQIHPDPPRLLTIAVTCFVIFLICVAVFLSTNCASSRTGVALNVGVIGSGVADLVTTRQAINSGRGIEANSIMGQGAIRQALLKSLGISTVIAVAWAMEEGGTSKSIWAHVIRSAAVVGWSIVAAHNAMVIR